MRKSASCWLSSHESNSGRPQSVNDGPHHVILPRFLTFQDSGVTPESSRMPILSKRARCHCTAGFFEPKETT